MMKIQLIVITKDKSVNSFAKGYHAYKDLWKLFINEGLSTAMVSDKVADKYAVCVEKNGVIEGHLCHSKNERFAKTIYYFLSADTYAECKVVITGK